jgi:hypothetical protein
MSKLFQPDSIFLSVKSVTGSDPVQPPVRISSQQQVVHCLFDKNIDLQSLTVAIKEYRSCLTNIIAMFHDFRYNPALEDCSVERMKFQFLRGIYAQKIAEQSGIQTMEIGSLHQAFSYICEVRWQTMKNITGFQNRDCG